MVTWLIGLSGAGKSTLGKMLYDTLKSKQDNVVLLDGDTLREIWRDQLGHDINDRRINAERISHLSKMLDQQGIHVVACVLSLFPEWQKWNRENIKDYYEIFLNIPMEILEKRDTKGLYRGFNAGEITNVVGKDIPFPIPPDSDLQLVPPLALAPPNRY